MYGMPNEGPRGMSQQEIRYQQAIHYMGQVAWAAGRGDELLRAMRQVALEPVINEPTQWLPVQGPRLVRPYVT